MINLHEEKFDELKEKEQIVDEIKEEKNIRDHLNFYMAHGFIIVGVVIAVCTRFM